MSSTPRTVESVRSAFAAPVPGREGEDQVVRIEPTVLTMSFFPRARIRESRPL